MTDLIINLTDSVGLKHLGSLVEKNEWDNIFILTNEEMMSKFNPNKEVNMVLINSKQPTEKITQDILKFLKGQIKGFEVAVNFFSGSGKEHMALVSALIKMGLGFRLVKQGKDEFEEV
ncbi:MAG: hypothetical protein ACOC2U_02850 [bacterium]